MGGRKNKSLIFLFFCLCFLMGLGLRPARADLVVKIGYVDLERIFRGYEKTRELEAKLKLENDADQQMLSERRQEIEKEIEKLKEELKMQESILSESAREEKQAEIQRKTEELPLIIKSIAEKEGYRFVFDVRSLFYATPEKEFDLTDKVLARLNEEYKKQKSKAGE